MPEGPAMLPFATVKAWGDVQVQRLDRHCEVAEGGGSAVSIAGDGTALRGCGVDVTTEYGELYDPVGDGWIRWNNWVGLKARPFEIPLPPLDALPTRPEHHFDRLAAMAMVLLDQEIEPGPLQRPAAEHARPYHDAPLLWGGPTWFALRPAIARETARRPDFAAWVRDRLRDEERVDLARLRDRLRRRFPQLSESELAEVVARAWEGRRSPVSPTGELPAAGLERYLAAWLGDVPVHDLFARWESDWINSRIAGRATTDLAGFVERWKALRRLFELPSYARVMTLMAPVLDPGSGRIGYYRILLPRPSWFGHRVRDNRRHLEFHDLPLDLVPDLPFLALAFDDALEAEPDLGGRLAASGYRVVATRYELLDKPRRHQPVRAFAATRVTAELGRENEAGSARVRWDFRFDRKRGVRGVRIETAALEAGSGDELEALVATAERP
jgi:hypothetical protein